MLQLCERKFTNMMEEKAPAARGRRWPEKQRKKSPAPFVLKTYELVESSGTPQAVTWSQDGMSFIVWSPQDFARLVLPRFFKHCNFSSFIRQLNTYGFKKFASDQWEFRHDQFQRGKRHLLVEIRRRKCQPSVFPNFLKALEKCPTAAEENELIQENKILQVDKAELQSQIAHYKAIEVELRRCLSQSIYKQQTGLAL